jgi:hypothetical protein
MQVRTVEPHEQERKTFSIYWAYSRLFQSHCYLDNHLNGLSPETQVRQASTGQQRGSERASYGPQVASLMCQRSRWLKRVDLQLIRGFSWCCLIWGWL